jgi:hypothetical protein
MKEWLLKEYDYSTRGKVVSNIGLIWNIKGSIRNGKYS